MELPRSPMDNYAYNSYPDSGDSSPRSREIDFENPPPWEDQSQQPNQPYKVKFMCSYGGKIHPRPHDNQLAYIGGETKILAVDRNTKFSHMISKLSALCGDTDVSFKYQLPGEDLDALISVTNDDDLEHMMHEYDRLFRASAKPARMRLFLFPVIPSPAASFSSDGGRSDRDRFVEALNSGPSHVVETTKTGQNNVDFLFGLEKGVPPGPKVPELPEVHVGSGHDNRVIGSDQLNLQTHLQRLQIREHEQHQAMYRKSSDDNIVGAGVGGGGVGGYGGSAGEYYVHKGPEKIPQPTMPASMPPPVSAPPGYWPEKQVAGGFHAPVTVTTTPPPQEQQVYMIPAGHGPVYHHNPVVRQVTGQTGQGYYVQRMGGPVPQPGGHEVYREQPVYNMVSPPQQQQQPPPLSTATAATMGMGRPGGPGGVAVADTGYTQVAYDSGGGRQVFYTAPGGVVQQQQQQPPPPQYQGVGVGVSGDMRGVVGGALGGQEGKVVTNKVSQTSM